VLTITNQLPSQNQVTLAFNADCTVSHITDARGYATAFGYTNGNRTSMAPPAPLGSTSYGYDGLSRATSILDGLGQTTRATYGANDRRIRLDYQDGSSMQYAYDLAGNLLSMTDQTGTTGFSYDARNRVTRKTSPDGDSRT
jgi:YD repeat-containing protein